MKRKKSQNYSSNVLELEREPKFNKHTIPKKEKRPQIYPKNLSQEDYLIKLNDFTKPILFAIGPAGTGKTLMAVQWAVDEFRAGNAKKIIITRPAVSVDEEHGFLPGDLNQKMAPWTRPIFDVFEENFSMSTIEHYVSENIFETSPLAYMRGRTFKDAIVIADECQLTTPNQMKMLLTRIGDGSRLIVTGDLEQADRGSDNGLLDFVNRFEICKSDMIAVARFTEKDVVRHPAVQDVLNIYNTTSI
jgi:phosphate starvation-inducible PhoH-like protein